jgi:hypothetical protein
MEKLIFDLVFILLGILIVLRVRRYFNSKKGAK